MPERYGFDFDESNSDLRIGLEVEYPGMNPSDEKFISRGRDTSGLQNDMNLPRHLHGRAVYDGTVGLEVVSDVMNLEDAPDWYAELIDYVEDEYNTGYQPTGLMHGGSTAGLHMHLSSLTRRQAEELYQISQQPWAKVLFCSSIANDGGQPSWPVFRGGRYCQMNFNGDRYACVNGRGSGHYEWRMPEPMTPEHMEVVVKFLRLFEQEPDAAVQYAQEVLDDADDRVTSIRRAEATGMDIETIPTVDRQPSEEDPENFFDAVANDWSMPEIHRVSFDGQDFYYFETELRPSYEFEADGVEFRADQILRADSLNPVQEPTLADDIERAYQHRLGDNPRETEATKELKKIVKKKKNKI